MNSRNISAAGLLIAFVFVDRVFLNLADLPISSLDNRSLFLASLREHPILAVIAVGFVIAATSVGAANVRWADLGPSLRWFAVALIAVLTWRRLFDSYDYLYDQWHLLDRALLLAFAVFAIRRPIGLLGFVLVVRLLAAPGVETLFSPGNNIDELPVLILIVIGAATLLTSRFERFEPAAIAPIAVAAIAAQFFVPGWTKFRSGWAATNELSNLPLNGHAQGWLGAGSGELAAQMADVLDGVEPVILLLTLALELGAFVVVLRLGLLKFWLPLLVLFHLGIGLAIGFWFLEFVVVELAFAALIATGPGVRWAEDGFSGGAALIAMGAVVLGSTIFHPPTLAWYDGPVVVRYDIDGTDTEGRVWALESGDFAPYDDYIAFGALDLGPTEPVASGYGSVSRVRFNELLSIGTSAELEAHEKTLFAQCDPLQRQTVVRLLQAFMSDSHNDRLRSLPGPPVQFSTSRPGENYDHANQIVELAVTRITVLRVAGEEHEREELALTVDENNATFTWPCTPR